MVMRNYLDRKKSRVYFLVSIDNKNKFRCFGEHLGLYKHERGNTLPVACVPAGATGAAHFTRRQNNRGNWDLLIHEERGIRRRTKVAWPAWSSKDNGDLRTLPSDVKLGIWPPPTPFSPFLLPPSTNPRCSEIVPQSQAPSSIPSPLFPSIPPPLLHRHRKVARRHLLRMPTPSRDIPRALERAPTNTGSKTRTQTRHTRLGSPVPRRTMDTPPSRSEPRILLARLVGAVAEAAEGAAVIFSMMSPPGAQRSGISRRRVHSVHI